MNNCVFSPDRKYRYYLKHRWDELMPEKAMMWIGLNPSTADENKLDPTLRRIKGFCTREGYNCFYMLNLFAFRATRPIEMTKEEYPIGPQNNYWLTKIAVMDLPIICAWGTLGFYKHQDDTVYRMLAEVLGKKLQCLDLTQKGFPQHPLYVAKDTELKPYQ